jgi:hypothetical protein
MKSLALHSPDARDEIVGYKMRPQLCHDAKQRAMSASVSARATCMGKILGRRFWIRGEECPSADPQAGAPGARTHAILPNASKSVGRLRQEQCFAKCRIALPRGVT